MDSWSLVVILGSVVAVAAGVRSTWSPCGLSMLSSITPFGERGRGHRYGATATWFVVGAVGGGACLGGLAAGLAAMLRASGIVDGHPAVVLSLAAVASLAAAAVDAGLFGEVIPLWRRQVNDAWLSQFRGWAYGLGFGWQIGTGLTTYIMTAAVLLTVVLAALTGDPAVALGLGIGFGLVRGGAVLLTSRALTPPRLRQLHRRMERAGPSVRWATIAIQGAGGLIVGAVALGPWVVLGVGGLVAVIAGARRGGVTRTPGRTRARAPAPAGERRA